MDGDPTPPEGFATPVLRAFAAGLDPDPGAALTATRAQRIPVSELDALDPEALPPGLTATTTWRSAVEADRRRAERLARAAAIVEAALTGVEGVALGRPSLGWVWSSDIDVYVTETAVATAGQALAGSAVALDGLESRLERGGGAPAPPRHFAVLEAGEVLALAELNTRLWDGGADAAPAVHRADRAAGAATLHSADAARRRAAKLASERRATVRGLLELSSLPPGTRVSRGARARHGELARALDLPGLLPASGHTWIDAPWILGRARGLRSLVRARVRRPRQLRVAFCGVDGAGKSTQAKQLVENLTRAGVPAQASWARLGNKASAPVASLAALAQRLLPSGSHSFQAVRAEAGRSAPAEAPPTVIAPPLTRRGPVGWSWALAVTLDYIARTHAARRRAGGGVLVLDRALPDALVELQDDYGVALRLTLQRRLLERWAPRPHVIFYLQLEGAVAKARKDDLFTAAELDVQRARYEALLATQPGVTVLDARRSREELAAEALRRLAAG